MTTQRIELTLRMPDGTLATVGVDVTNTPRAVADGHLPLTLCVSLACGAHETLRRGFGAKRLHQRGPFVVPTDEPASTPGEGRVSP